MEIYKALEAFGCLSQETRLKVFQHLIEYGRKGASPGKIAEELELADNTLSFHLAHMSKAGLVTSEKNGRSITYFANTKLASDLAGFLLKNCCAKEERRKARAAACCPAKTKPSKSSGC